ncbi:methylmalonyl Co-A mutase-associated GTPase MeaB [Thermodesulfobacteriota bacterium]
MSEPEQIIERIKGGDIRAMARLITRVEKREPDAVKVIKEIYSQCGKAHLVGITGPPGVGKSCLVSSLVRELRERGKSVGVLAVDPSSPFSGGALLGDRARMIDLSGDKDVFIRSLASRGASGGLSAAVNDAADIMDVFGKDIILIETVGVGQGEIEIARLAHTVLLVLMPGYGDTLQALKAGIMEIADIFVVNKSDKPGADQTVAELSTVQEFRGHQNDVAQWEIPITKTSALKGDGVPELADGVDQHYAFLNEHNLISEKGKARRTKEFLDILTQQIRNEFLEELKTDPILQEWTKKIGNLELDPYSASEEVIDMIKEAREKRRGDGAQ